MSMVRGRYSVVRVQVHAYRCPMKSCRKNVKNAMMVLESSDRGVVVIGSDLTCVSEINKWVSKFGELTDTKWNSRDSRPPGQRIVYGKKCVCHRSGFQKVPLDKNKKGNSKNTDC